MSAPQWLSGQTTVATLVHLSAPGPARLPACLPAYLLPPRPPACPAPACSATGQRGNCHYLLARILTHLPCLPWPPQRSKVEKELAALDGRLGNASFVQRAPEKVVEEVRAQAEEMRQQLAMVDDKLSKFAALQ